jgi:glycosyltransferase involved in cell wall biosynthesis
VDVVHFLDGEHAGQFLPRLLKAVGSRVQTVVTFHQPPEMLETLLDPATLRWFDHIVLMSPSQLPFLEARGLHDKVSVIPHGIDTAFFHPEVAKARAEGVQCITAGHWLRDWGVFAEAARRLPHITFHIVTGRETGADDLPNVVRHQGIDDEALATLYRRSDILFLPLHDSTANNALLEGIASGLPVVATGLVSTRYYLAGDETAFIPSGDDAAAVSALSQLADNAERRQAMGVRARVQAETLSWDVIARDYEALYANLVAR